MCDVLPSAVQLKNLVVIFKLIFSNLIHTMLRLSSVNVSDRVICSKTWSFHSSVATHKYYSCLCVDSFIVYPPTHFLLTLPWYLQWLFFYGTYCCCTQSCLIFWSLVHSHNTLSSTFSIHTFKYQVSAAAEVQLNLNQLKFPLQGSVFSFRWKGCCTFNGTTLSHSSIQG